MASRNPRRFQMDQDLDELYRVLCAVKAGQEAVGLDLAGLLGSKTKPGVDWVAGDDAIDLFYEYVIDRDHDDSSDMWDFNLSDLPEDTFPRAESGGG
jgi:hypothetical protein